MADQYFIRTRDGRVQGPFPAVSIQSWIASGKVRPEMEFSVDGAAWVQGHACPELFGTEEPEEVEVIGEDPAPRVQAPVPRSKRRMRSRRYSSSSSTASSRGDADSAEKKDEASPGCVVVFVVLAVLGYILSECGSRNGVPREVINAIKSDLKENNWYYTRQYKYCKLLWWDHDTIRPVGTESEASKRYTVSGTYTGEENAFGLHQEGSAMIYYLWDPDSKKAKFLGVELGTLRWER